MRILGIDPGIAIVGTGVIQYENNKFKVLYYDAVTTKAHTPLEERIKLVYEGVGQLMDYYKPDALSMTIGDMEGARKPAAEPPPWKRSRKI